VCVYVCVCVVCVCMCVCDLFFMFFIAFNGRVEINSVRVYRFARLVVMPETSP